MKCNVSILTDFLADAFASQNDLFVGNTAATVFDVRQWELKIRNVLRTWQPRTK